MELLIDTHVALWWLEDETQLSQSARDSIADLRNRVFVSAVVAWKIAIKRGLGKLSAPIDLKTSLAKELFEFEPVSITIEDALAVEELPLHHRDPFDRLLIAQAIQRDWTIVSRDSRDIVFTNYDVKLLIA